MDRAYYEQPVGSEGHRAAYIKEFEADGGVSFPFPDDPDLSYEIDNAHELALDRWFEENEPDPEQEAGESAPEPGAEWEPEF